MKTFACIAVSNCMVSILFCPIGDVCPPAMPADLQIGPTRSFVNKRNISFFLVMGGLDLIKWFIIVEK